MPVVLVKAALTSSSAFFSEAAAKTVIARSCAADGAFAMASVMRQATTRCSILRPFAAAAHERADTPSGRTRCREAANPEAPFRDKRRAYGAPWAAAHSNRIGLGGKGGPPPSMMGSDLTMRVGLGSLFVPRTRSAPSPIGRGVG